MMKDRALTSTEL